MNAALEFPVLPRRLVLDPHLTDEEFEQLCVANDLVQLERTREGTIVVNPPTGLETSDGNSEIIYQLRAWWKQHRRGRVFDSNAGFFLPDGSMLSPDAAYIAPEQLRGLTREASTRFFRGCPEFVVELLSQSDRTREAEQKMESWIANGALLGWLVNPYSKTVLVYRPGHEAEVETGKQVSGSGPVQRLVLDLSEVWSCYEL